MLRLGTIYPRDTPFLGELAETVVTSKEVGKYFSPQVTVVNGADSLSDLIRRDKIDALITYGGFYADTYPDLAAISNVPFGLRNLEHQAWLKTPEARGLVQQVENKYEIKILPLAVLSAQLFGWWGPDPTETGFVGKKMRISGFAKPVLQKAGVQVVSDDLGVEGLKTALANSVLDGVEYADPYIDSKSGFSKISRLTLVPGWHEMGSLIALIMRAETWNSFQYPEKANFLLWSDQISTALTDFSMRNQVSAIAELHAQGTIMKEIPNAQLLQFKTIWENYAKSINDPLFRQILASIMEFKNRTKVQQHLTSFSSS